MILHRLEVSQPLGGFSVIGWASTCFQLRAEGIKVTATSTTRTLQSEGGDTVERLRVFVAEGSASDLFWLEMVFKSSRLPYSLEVATDAQTAKHYLDNNPKASEMDLIFLDSLELFERFPEPASIPAFLFTHAPSENQGEHIIEKPFTQQKLLDCLWAVGLDSWASRLAGKPGEQATAA